LLQELRAAGVPVASASDNVRDHWYYAGDYDMLNVWKLTTEMSHTELVAGHWADLVTSIAGEAMGLPHHVGYGQVADLILFPNARRISELFARPQVDRLVIRKGRVQTTSLPDFAELDDLVAVKTERSLEEDKVFTLSS
jgi:cytosine deaminase